VKRRSAGGSQAGAVAKLSRMRWFEDGSDHPDQRVMYHPVRYGAAE